MADIESSQVMKIKLTKEEYEQWKRGNLQLVIQNTENDKEFKIKMDFYQFD